MTDALVALFDELEAEYAQLPNTEGLLSRTTASGYRKTFSSITSARPSRRRASRISLSMISRHTAITRGHIMHLSMSAAMRMAGHSSAQSHKKYVNLKTDMLVDVLTGCLQRQAEEKEKAVKSP
ncbi:MAG: hypothetical protein ACREQP_03600 [Candidatus Binatia bacterium]